MTALRNKKKRRRGTVSQLGIATVTMSPKGWIVIPKEMRERHGLQPGKEVKIVDLNGSLIIMPAFDDPIEAGYGMLEGGPSMTEALLKDRAEELEREERDLPPPPSNPRTGE